MKKVLVDSSTWIDYFRSGQNSSNIDELIENNLIVINEIILAELVPFLKIKGQQKIISLLNSIEKVKLNINWNNLIDLQFKCLKKGINKVGIPDLMIIQNVIDYNISIYTLDKHFELIKDIYSFDIYSNQV